MQEPTEEEVKATPAKRGRGKSAKTPVEKETPVKKPAGRRGKKAEPEPEPELEVEELKQPAKRGRKKAPATPEKEEEKISPVK